MVSTKTVTRRRIEGRRDEILAIARQAFYEQGYQKASMRVIAGRAGLTQAALYYHFENKEELLHTIIAQFSERFFLTLVDCLSKGRSPEDSLEAMIHAQIGIIVTNKKDIKILIEDKDKIEKTNLSQIKRTERDILSLYKSCLKEIQAVGRIPPGDLNVMAFGIIGMINSLYQWHRDDGPMGVEELGDAMSGMLLRGLLAGDATPAAPPARD
jgi:AcrR family transcriptional regulator